MNASVLSGNLYKAAYEAVHPLDENGKRVTRCNNVPLPVLAHLLVTDHDGRLAIYSHDLETPIVSYAPARIEESFAICVPAHPFLDWMEIIQKDDIRVDLTADPGTCCLIVRAGNARATFKCMDAQEFPPVTQAIEPMEKDPTLASVGKAVSKDDHYPALQKVCHRDGIMIGADGYRMHIAPSTKTAIPENYPDVTPILATLDDSQNMIIVPALPLLRAVKNLKAAAKAGDGWVTFHSNGSLKLHAESAAGDISTAEVEILNSTGAVEFTIQFQYALDALMHICPTVKGMKRDGLFPQTVTLRVAPQTDPMGDPVKVWFVNGDLKAVIMQKWNRTVPQGTAKPSKSELMSAYNRQRAQLRREGQPTWELNRAFGDLQRKNWQEVTPEHLASWGLLTAIVEKRRMLANFPGFDPKGIGKVIDFISTPCDPAEVERYQAEIARYWNKERQCYTTEVQS